MDNNRDMKKNKLPSEAKKWLMINKIITLLILIGGFILLIAVFYFNSLNQQEKFIDFIGNNILLFSFLAIIVSIVGGSLLFVVSYRSNSIPKYIRWDEKGIYLINRKGEKRQISWNKVNSIYKSGKYAEINKKVPGYYLDLKEWIGPRRLNGKIGEELKKYYENLKDGQNLQS